MKPLIAMCMAVALGAVASAKPMNVVFILADDLGWADTTLYGQTDFYETPNLERLARRGMTFTRAYANSPLCSPTRASILTGQTPARHGSTAPHHHLHDEYLEPKVFPSAPPYEKARSLQSVSRLDTAFPTLGKLIQSAGYKTGHFGKWHLGREPYSPLQHGFDVDIPHWPGPGPAGSFVAPWRYPNFKARVPGEHIEDRMADEAVTWLDSVKKAPFYLQYWQFSVHAPFDAKEALIEKYRQQVDPNDPQRCPVYAAMVESLDDAVGTLLDAIDQAGLAGETIIVFASDNGGNMYDRVEGNFPTSNTPLRGGKATMYEGGIRVPCVVVWPGVTKPGSRSDAIIQLADFYPTLLDGLGIDLPQDWPIDGIDIMPALKGGSLDREAIFTYFPHGPQVPDWLPPSISVHSGDWKLIRLFHEGEDGAHDWRLYNLKDDIGEKHNLAAAYPEKVRTMDRMIAEHIRETGAVVPLPNPDFDPEMYVPENIGVPKSDWKLPPGVEAGGWAAAGTSKIYQKDGVLEVQSSGRDPYIVAKDLEALSGGPFTLSLRMRSNTSGQAFVYYNTPFNAKRTTRIAVRHDGRLHNYSTTIPAKSLNALRIDPATSKGVIQIERMDLKDATGQVVRSWTF